MGWAAVCHDEAAGGQPTHAPRGTLPACLPSYSLLQGDDAAHDGDAGQGVDAHQAGQQGEDGNGLNGGAPAGGKWEGGGMRGAGEFSRGGTATGWLGANAARLLQQLLSLFSQVHSPEVVDLLDALKDLVDVAGHKADGLGSLHAIQAQRAAVVSSQQGAAAPKAVGRTAKPKPKPKPRTASHSRSPW